MAAGERGGEQVTFTPDFPGAIVVEAANYGYAGKKNQPQAWCLHTPEEAPDDYPATPTFFHNTDRNASTHYFVSYLGLVFQCVLESEGAYANGREGIYSYFPWEDPNLNLNLQTLTVEIEGYAATIHQTMPRGSPQWVSLVRLMAHRCQARGIPPERAFGHYQVSVYRSDPGQLDIAALVADVKALLPAEMEDSNLPDPIITAPDGKRGQLGVAGLHGIGSDEHVAALVAGGARVVPVTQEFYDWMLANVNVRDITGGTVVLDGVDDAQLEEIAGKLNDVAFVLNNPPLLAIAKAVADENARRQAS